MGATETRLSHAPLSFNGGSGDQQELLFKKDIIHIPKQNNITPRCCLITCSSNPALVEMWGSARTSIKARQS
jgi:hypothetical protein